MTNLGRNLLLAFLAIAAPVAVIARQPATSPAAIEADPPAPFLPAGFTVPTTVKAGGFTLMPLGPAVTQRDYDAYMSSIEHLQATFTHSAKWPRKDLTAADAVKDMANEDARFKTRKSFAYAVLTPDGSRERGSVYISPSPVGDYDAVVRMWVTKAEYDRGFDTELYKWVTTWIKTDWPFRKVAYPGRTIDWQTWDTIVAAHKR